MGSQLKEMADAVRWRILANAATRALEEAGHVPQRMPGRGRANVWAIEEDGQPKRVSIRTTRDRWFAFSPLANGTAWKTLDDVDIVLVAAVDDPDEPNSIEVYRFDADEVRKRFDRSYAARIQAGQKEPDDFGMWVGLDPDSRGLPASVGSGLASEHTPIAIYALEQLIAGHKHDESESAENGAAAEPSPNTIAEVMNQARMRIATLSGVHVEAVKLNCCIEG